jgi:hypothetical protein
MAGLSNDLWSPWISLKIRPWIVACSVFKILLTLAYHLVKINILKLNLAVRWARSLTSSICAQESNNFFFFFLD